MQPKEVLFRVGDDSQSGIFIVVEGRLGVYLDDGDSLCCTNMLRTGESVGDLDVLDGEAGILLHTCQSLSGPQLTVLRLAYVLTYTTCMEASMCAFWGYPRHAGCRGKI